MNKEQIYITGAGAVTAVGVGVPAFWQGLVSGQCGISEISWAKELALPAVHAAQISGFHPRDFLSMRLVQDLEPYMQYAYVAAEEAVRESGLNTKSSRVGIVMGTALGGITIIGDTGVQYEMAGKSAGPKFLTKAMGNIAASQFSINYGIQGPSLTVSTACSSGGDAVTMGALLIRSGMTDAVVVMAGESAVCPTLIQSLVKTGALSKTGESRPFDLSRNGFVLGEGGAAVVLESRNSVLQREAHPLAELLGCANNTDAYNPVSPNPDGTGAARCIRLALQDAGITPEQVDYINAHGTATAMGDVAETRAIHQVFGTRLVAVSSTKGSTGHMMGAGGVAELIACIQAVQTGVLPPNTGYTQADPDCRLNIVTKADRRSEIQIALSNAFGFGGQNSCILVGKV